MMPLQCTPLPSGFYSLVAGSTNFALLETSRFDEDNKRSYLFLSPLRILEIRRSDDLEDLFVELERETEQGRFVAGFISYEAGYFFEEKLCRIVKETDFPLAWFGVYEAPIVFNHETGSLESGTVPPPSSTTAEYRLRDCSLQIPKEEYERAVDRIKRYIAEGDTYQVNFTAKYRFNFSGSRLSLFKELRRKQKVSYSAFISFDDKAVLSFSPELFFRLDGERIATKPMKGTARRGRDLAEDDRTSRWLSEDEKNRSENLMIVDLLRNDIGKIAETASVRVRDMFSVEKYETLFQMTSTVEGTLRSTVAYGEIFRNLFPSGSVTGAPKIRTMEIIRELERHDRGVYCGAIGFIAPERRAVFNVAIRTLLLEMDKGEMGVGSGIVTDSHAADEFDECRLKADFLTKTKEEFHLLESILWDGEYRFLDQHLQRMEASARYFDYHFDRESLIDALRRNRERLSAGNALKVRLLLDENGSITIENIRIENVQSGNTIRIAAPRTSSGDRFLYHKTTFRRIYDDLYAEAQKQNLTDFIFLNENDEITEGTVSNIFIEKGGKLLTPPVRCGLLPGIQRAYLLRTNPNTEERILTIEDLRHADAIFLCNAIRGMRKVFLAE